MRRLLSSPSTKWCLASFGFSIQRYLFYLLILFLPTQFGKHFWPEFSYVQGIRSDYLSPTLYTTDVLILFLFLLQIVTWIKVLVTKNQKSKTKNQIVNSPKKRKSAFDLITNYQLLITLFKIKKIQGFWKTGLGIVILIIGIFFSSSPLAGFYGLVKLLEMIFLGYFVWWYYSNTKSLKQELSTLSLLFSFSILFESTLAIIQFLKQSSLGGLLYFFGERIFIGSTPGIANVSINGELILRPYGTLPHPNVLAGFLLVVMTFLLFVYRDIRQSTNNLHKNILFESAGRRIENFFNKTSRFAFQARSKNNVITQTIVLLAFVSGTIALMLTFSRIPILLWIGVVLFHLFISRTSSLSESGKHRMSRRVLNTSLRPPQTKTWPTFVILVFIVFLFFFFPLPQRFFETRIDEEAITTRIELTQASLKMIADYPIFGVGLNNFLIKIPEYFENTTSGVFQPAHNIYLLIAAQLGLIIFIIIMIFIMKTISVVFRKIQKTKNPFDTAVFMSIIMLLTIGFFDHYLLTLQQGQLLLSFFLGAAFVKMKNKKV